MVKKAERVQERRATAHDFDGRCPYCQPGMEEHFRHNSFFVGSGSRKAVAEGRADFTPAFFYDIPGSCGALCLSMSHS